MLVLQTANFCLCFSQFLLQEKSASVSFFTDCTIISYLPHHFINNFVGGSWVMRRLICISEGVCRLVALSLSPTSIKRLDASGYCESSKLLELIRDIKREKEALELWILQLLNYMYTD